MDKIRIFSIGFFILGALVLEHFGLFKNPQIFGLFLDAIGAYFLAQSFITKKLEDIVSEAWGNESPKYPGGTSENLGISLYQQSKEAITGFCILTAGFISQGIGVVYPEFTLPYPVGGLVVTMGLLVIALFHTRLFNRERVGRIIEEKDKEMSKKGYR
ncbi:MAG TPA: hypothetical protein VGA53_00410 [Candidatus Paceibacterota bacterium]